MAQTKIRQDQIDGYMHEQDADLLLGVNDGGTQRTAIQVHGDEGSISFPRQSGAAATKGSTTIANSTNTTLTYNTELWDTLGEYNTSTGVFTAKDAGVYLVIASSRWDNTNNTREYRLGSSSSGTGGFFVEEWVSGTWGRFNQNGSALITLDAGGTISIWCSQSSGGNETISDNRMFIIKVA